jgi:recombinational DNA repair protein RecR
MSFRICENCASDKAVTGSDLCDICEDAFDDNAYISGMTREELAKEMGIVVLPKTK